MILLRRSGGAPLRAARLRPVAAAVAAAAATCRSTRRFQRPLPCPALLLPQVCAADALDAILHDMGQQYGFDRTVTAAVKQGIVSRFKVMDYRESFLRKVGALGAA